MKNETFWETKKLTELTHDEWESLCDGCAKCCVQRDKDGKAIQPKGIASLCYLLDMEPCRCSSYTIRKELLPKCIVLSPDQPELFEQMPETCSYRLLHEGKPLPEWHPLITGDPASNLRHRVVVDGELNLGTALAHKEIVDEEPDLGVAPAPEAVEIPLSVEEKTSQIAEDAKRMIYSTLKSAETTNPSGKFLTTTSHEIRTALNGIVGMSQLISDTQLTQEQRTCIDAILQSTTGLLKTINHVLDVSKIESGQMDICETATDLYSICDRLYRMFRPLAEQKGLDFKCECQGTVPLSVMCDEGLVERVLNNLVGNALKHTHQGSVFLNIDCQKKGKEGAEVLFQVIDTGDGIDHEKQASIKENPKSANAGILSQLHQTGNMDLAVCRQLIELMGGELELASAKGKGSIFRVNMTFQQANHPASFNLLKNELAKTITPNTRVLLAEDNKVNQKVVVSILQKAGCEVDAVDNGKDAIRELCENSYDMVLMDCQMPVMDGYEAATRIRAMDEPTCKIPIIALTAHAMKGDRQKCFDSGMDDYLPKPIGRQELIDTINKYAVSA